MEESVEALSERLATRSKRIPLLIGVGSIAPLIAVFLLWGRHDLWLSVLTVVLVAFLGLVVVGMAVSGAGNLRKAGQVLEGLPGFRLVRGKAFPPVIEGTTEANGIETPVAVAFSGETNFELAIPCRVQAHVSELRGVQLTELLENVKLWGSPRIAGQMENDEIKASPGKELTFLMDADWDAEPPEDPIQTRSRLLARIEDLLAIRKAFQDGSSLNGPLDVRPKDTGPWRIVGWCPSCRRFRDEPIDKSRRLCNECSTSVYAVAILRRA